MIFKGLGRPLFVQSSCRLLVGTRLFASGFRPHTPRDEPDGPIFANKKGVGQGPYTRMRTGADDGKFRPEMNPIDFVDSRPVKSPRASPQLKAEMRKGMPTYLQSPAGKALEASFDEFVDSSHPLTYQSRDPAEFMKHMDGSFESFFYQRDYSERNFSFYL